ncbi:MAG: tRNA(Ile)-lysidine synthase [Arenicella sp.]|jgi:tRNA(Ile)-lysidine synthase
MCAIKKNGTATMTFSVKEFGAGLFGGLDLSHQGRYYVAFSGGLDSTVLLHLMAQLRDQHGFELIALHVSHNLQAQSQEWAEHCSRVCQALEVPLRQTSLNLDSSAESTARDARYQWFREQVEYGSVIMTAHHQQDRAETFLFNLMRGAGSTGLSSLRAKRPFFGAKLVRPLLPFSQASIVDYAEQHNLQWVEDPSNQDQGYSRNEIRHQVLPVLQTFRADAIQSIARAAANLEQENGLLREVAICDLVDVREHSIHPLDHSHALCVDDMCHLTSGRQANVVRFWLQSLKLHSPSRKFLARLLLAISEPPASTAILQEDGCQFRFYKGYMYVMPAQEPQQQFSSVSWQDVEQPLSLFENKLMIGSTQKLRELVLSYKQPHLRLAAKSELINPKALQGHSLNLKTWMQDMGVPPWRRQALPLLTMSDAKNDVIIAPVDQQLQTDWLSLDAPY